MPKLNSYINLNDADNIDLLNALAKHSPAFLWKRTININGEALHDTAGSAASTGAAQLPIKFETKAVHAQPLITTHTIGTHTEDTTYTQLTNKIVISNMGYQKILATDKDRIDELLDHYSTTITPHLIKDNPGYFYKNAGMKITKNKISVTSLEFYKESGLRIIHHRKKTADRTVACVANMLTTLRTDNGSGTPTSIRGDFAALQIMHTLMHDNFDLKRGFGASTNGFDQIWAKRKSNGDIEEYIILECKGSIDATLGDTLGGGMQMSQSWVFETLIKMASGHASYCDSKRKANEQRLAQKILDALTENTTSYVKVSGLIIHSMHKAKNKHLSKSIIIEGGHCYNDPLDPSRPAQLLSNIRASRSSSSHTSAPTVKTGFLI